MCRRPRRPPLFPSTPLSRSPPLPAPDEDDDDDGGGGGGGGGGAPSPRPGALNRNGCCREPALAAAAVSAAAAAAAAAPISRSEEPTSEIPSPLQTGCRPLLE